MSKANKSPARQTKLTFKRGSKNNLNAYEQMQSTQLTAAELPAPRMPMPTTDKIQLKLSASKIRLQTSKTELPSPDAVRRKSAPQLFSFSIAPQLVTAVGEAQMVPRLPAYEMSNCIPRSRTLGLPTEQTIACSADSNSEPSSSITGGSSTSPESLLDNILSGASSVSVQSSSASDITVAPPPPPPPPLPQLLSQAQLKSPVPPKPKRVLSLKASPELRVSPPTPDSGVQLDVTTLLMPGGIEPSETMASLASRSCSPLPSPAGTPLVSPSSSFTLRPATNNNYVSISFPEELKCAICMDVYTDPRTLHCLHSFCLQCLVNMNLRDEVTWEDRSSYSLRSSTPEINGELATVSPARQRGASFSLRSKKSLDRMMQRLTYYTHTHSAQRKIFRRGNDIPGNRKVCPVCKTALSKSTLNLAEEIAAAQASGSQSGSSTMTRSKSKAASAGPSQRAEPEVERQAAQLSTQQEVSIPQNALQQSIAEAVAAAVAQHTQMLTKAIEEGFRKLSEQNNPPVPPSAQHEILHVPIHSLEQLRLIVRTRERFIQGIAKPAPSVQRPVFRRQVNEVAMQCEPVEEVEDEFEAKIDAKRSTSACSSSTRLNASFANETESMRCIRCPICEHPTNLPVLGGVRQLPQNFLLVRRIEALRLQAGDDVISRVWCSLCSDEISAIYHCISCTLNLCSLCKEAHERQRSTANHHMRNILELRRARKQKQQQLGLGDSSHLLIKCGLHGFELKSFCVPCHQLACPDCLVLQHRNHRHETIAKAVVQLQVAKKLREATEQTRPLCQYAEHSIERLHEIARGINAKCDDIQAQVESFMNRYFEALQAHRNTLLQQISRARESKVELILQQQMELEKRTQQAMDAIRFSQELCDIGADVEILSLARILMKRFEHCQQFKPPVDPKISDSLHFLAKIRAPGTKEQHDIPLYGIITMQTVEPSLCTLQWEGFSQLRLHRKVDLLLLSRDADGVPLCHGGLEINCMIKYKDASAKFLPIDVSDHRDGTYSISFTPDTQGTLILTVNINERQIKGSPYTFHSRQVRPHTGIFHCCSFCSGKGSKSVKCSCDGRMPGYSGCGHGHVGHPGRRHWSCCGNVLENSECSVANKLLNT
ncbi:hypothetical protein ACLKA7_003796 [Drosophila subpalustris]